MLCVGGGGAATRMTFDFQIDTLQARKLLAIPPRQR